MKGETMERLKHNIKRRLYGIKESWRRQVAQARAIAANQGGQGTTEYAILVGVAILI